ncbi:MBL fold metallo-hydrolase [Paludicola sp. MB14-C6]|uniref:ComEC/Rec2 family competence protein n=1 Tax=Paludihabitans sp. MB14-C6 TaxID=3070656 RepID=UPI0027DDE165|nr:MBL fold metallo-hydrolase [Paludicola sp. MB14-C6]WMJ23287.1 MBL fold metallo-hydrolase [Paludicola sp. MB14-C6]
MAKRRKKRYKKNKKVNVAFCLIAAVLLSAFILVSLSEKMKFEYIPTISEVKEFFMGKKPTNINSDCSVHFIDVGQGDSALIVSDKQTILIDAGENDKGRIVADYLRKQKVKKIDLLVATHPHSDHIGGMDTIINEFEIGQIVMPKLPSKLVPTTRTYTDVLSAIANKGLKITPSKPEMTFHFGKGELKILGPVDEFEELNETSLVAQFKYDNDESFLFTGDMEMNSETALLNTGKNIQSNVLKVAHHGSSSSTNKKFFEKVNPDYCIISVGDGNKYNHPNKTTLDLIKSNNKHLYRTDYSGSVVFHIVNGEFKIETTHS